MTDGFRILIAATEKTGNTWLKYLLSHIYKLPTPYISQDFSEAEADSLGRRWVTHQHFLPERPLLDWAAKTQTQLVTMIRHPADILVSLYHYCCNYADHYKEDPGITMALAADAPARQETAHLPHHVVDGQLIRILQERIACDINISISWIRSGLCSVVRYEDLRVEPSQTLTTLVESIVPVSRARVEKAIKACDIKVLRDNYAIDSRFFRRALIEEWRSALPTHVLRRFAKEEPFRSQLSFLGYEVKVDKKRAKPRKERSIAPESAPERFYNGVPFVPILAELLESVLQEERTLWHKILYWVSRACFFRWANAAADEDPLGPEAIPRMTNLAFFVYKQRPDLQAAFPDIFDLNRLGYATWFLRYAGHRYELDRSFLTPIALSWLPRPPSRAARVRRAFGEIAVALSSWFKSLRRQTGRNAHFIGPRRGKDDVPVEAAVPAAIRAGVADLQATRLPPQFGAPALTVTGFVLADGIPTVKVGSSLHEMNQRITSVLCCPACHGELRSRLAQLQCETCGVTYRIQNEVPLFIQENVAAASSDHVSNPIGADFEEILRNGDGLILHIGAGATPQKYPTCIEFEHKIFKHTDVVGDAHQLPFRDGSFDRVFAFNVFEHLREPARAAAEVARVLKPGGTVAIHTAFLQPVHEEPAHFYNTTEYGLRRWFADFEIEKLSVTPNFSPGVMLAYLMSNVVNVLAENGVSWREQTIVQETTLGEWADFWAGKTGPPAAFDTLQNLPQAAQKKIAAGFELIGRKPR